LSRLGIGKVVACAPGQVTVEYFYSIARRRTETVPESQANVITQLASQTRCYIGLGEGRCQMGRIGRLFEGEYEVMFRQGQARYLRPETIHVRCLSPIDDPAETLILKGHETPFFHDRRFRFVHSLIRQRAACRGMTGLLSSRIELFPHQVEVVRRVLEDPVQRYLLADEVGLGKTVEAGVILRQFLLDDPAGQAVILVPPLLLDQWAEELEDKFQISRFGAERVSILGTENVGRALERDQWGMVVIDEAQHVAACAASEAPERRERFAAYGRLCRSADRLLLLSATPVLNNERDFLAMLHLLDPQLYALGDLEAFRARVRNRQEVGHLLLSLQEGSGAFALRSGIQRLRQHFPQDSTVSRLADDLERSLSTTPADASLRDEAIRATRVHISETYRIHRRMLRNRRGAVEVRSLAGRAMPSGQPTPRILEHDIDERSPHIHALLDEWRDSAAGFVSQEEAAGAIPGATAEAFRSIFSVFFQAAGSSLDLFADVIRLRLHPKEPAGSVEFPGAELRLLRQTPLFPGERELLEAALERLASPSEEGDRIRLLEYALQNLRRSARGGPPPKCVVFTSHTRACREILRRVQDQFGAQAATGYHVGLDRSQVEASIARFRNQPGCFVLVCDRAGEEGRNLQCAERVVHFDLPLSPNRMEQRIGRLDRIGRDRPVRSTVFIGPPVEHSLFQAWYRVLDEGFQLFDRSIASLQFFIDEQLPRLMTTLFREGAAGLCAQLADIRRGCGEEQERIDEQDALDAIDAFEQNAAACYEDIQKLESAHADLEDATHGWIGEALHFLRDPDFYRGEGTTLYGMDTDRWGALRTLVPSDWLQQRLSRHLQTPGAFDRKVALRVRGTPVFRIGEGFIDAIASYVGWDDRGQAFALWRRVPGWSTDEGAEWAGFRFNYVVSADLREARQALSQWGLPRTALRSLQRRADALLPPLIEVVFLDADGRPVTDPNLLSVLTRPYLTHGKGGSDYNLANERLPAIDAIVPPSRWRDLCTEARAVSAAEVLARGTPPLRERCLAFAAQAEREVGQRLAQLRLRLGRDQAPHAPGGGVSDRDIAVEEAVGASLVRGIRSPQLRLDSVGFIVVSGRPPARASDEEEAS
jgi:ATP-dependent helicase HepA